MMDSERALKVMQESRNIVFRDDRFAYKRDGASLNYEELEAIRAWEWINAGSRTPNEFHY